MGSFDEGVNYASIVDDDERAFTLSCFEDGEGYFQYEDGRFRAGIRANYDDLETFLKKCLLLIEKFKEA